MKKHKFKIGDHVVMPGTQVYCGRVVQDVRGPVEGVIKSISTGGAENWLVYEVLWKSADGRAGSNYMDEVCLESVAPTEDELAEVFKSLGVKP